MSDTKKNPAEIDLDDFLDLDFGNKSNPNTPTNDSIPDIKDEPINLDAETPSPANKPQEPETTKVADTKKAVLSSKEALELEFANSKAKETSASTLDFETTPNIDEPTPAVKPKSGFGSAFGKKDKSTKSNKTTGGLFGKKTPKSSDTNALDIGTPKKSAKKPNLAIIGAVIAVILLVIVLFTLMGGDELAPAPVVETPAPTEMQTTAEPPAPPTNITSEPVAPTSTPTPDPAPTTPTDVIPNTVPEVNPDEILGADIPEDPALLKEEIDRLSDTEQQLSEQSKMIKEQLDIMNDLTKAKDEEIALLEAQIAELEKQKQK